VKLCGCDDGCDSDCDCDCHESEKNEFYDSVSESSSFKNEIEELD